MINTTVTVNQPTELFFTAASGGSIDLSTFFIVDPTGVVDFSIVVSEYPGTGIYKFTYTPSTTGRTVITYNGEMIASLDVVARDVYAFLRNIEDEALGSWQWDKPAGKLVMLRQDGTPLASFDVVETTLVASRELTS